MTAQQQQQNASTSVEQQMNQTTNTADDTNIDSLDSSCSLDDFSLSPDPVIPIANGTDQSTAPSKEQFATCLQVLQYYNIHPSDLMKREMREFRVLLLDVTSQLQCAQLQEKGLTEKTLKRRQHLKKQKELTTAKNLRLKEADRKYINSVHLRKQRLQQLNSLCEQNAQGVIRSDKQKLIKTHISNENNENIIENNQDVDISWNPALPRVYHPNAPIQTNNGVKSELQQFDDTNRNGEAVSQENQVIDKFLRSNEQNDTNHAVQMNHSNETSNVSAVVSADSSLTPSHSHKRKHNIDNDKIDKIPNKLKFQQSGVHINQQTVSKIKNVSNVTIENETNLSKNNNTENIDEIKPDRPELHYPRCCYSCKKRFTKLHFFYDQFCPECSILNWTKRHQNADLNGKVILLTGSRVKIGYCCGLKLLRCGATVIATTRFPHDSARRYAAEKDYSMWKDNLHIYGLDLRDLSSVIKLTQLIKQFYQRLDCIINNAAQTVRRPPDYYSHLIPIECKNLNELPENINYLIKGDVYNLIDQNGKLINNHNEREQNHQKTLTQILNRQNIQLNQALATDNINALSTATGLENSNVSNSPSLSNSSNISTSNRSALLSQLPILPNDILNNETSNELFPKGRFDVTGQQLDLRKINSWALLLHEIDPLELVEVFTVNCLSPYIINGQLRDLMTQTSGDKYIINVSAMEGKFYRHKSPTHPHTNSAKAALNMMTRTSAQDYALDHIYMNSVDTGWINDENSWEIAQKIAQTNFQTPIDEQDAMARILDPLFIGINTGYNMFGKFIKDFRETEW